MLVILASAGDDAARHLVSRWGQDAALLTPQDLSVAGWRYHSDRAQGTMCFGGRILANLEVRGVLTRLPSVFADELIHIVPEDRQYVAAEMTAFLAAWLASLDCPVLNRPSPSFLCGPPWRREKWVQVAAKLGVPVWPVSVHASSDTSWPADVMPLSCSSAIVVGNRAIGRVDETLLDYARTLARAAKVELLCARFTGSGSAAAFVTADYWPDITSPGVAAALREYLLSGAAS